MKAGLLAKGLSELGSGSTVAISASNISSLEGS